MYELVETVNKYKALLHPPTKKTKQALTNSVSACFVLN